MRGRINQDPENWFPFTFTQTRATVLSGTPPKRPGWPSLLAREQDPRLPGEVILRAITEGV